MIDTLIFIFKFNAGKLYNSFKEINNFEFNFFRALGLPFPLSSSQAIIFMGICACCGFEGLPRHIFSYPLNVQSIFKIIIQVIYFIFFFGLDIDSFGTVLSSLKYKYERGDPKSFFWILSSFQCDTPPSPEAPPLRLQMLRRRWSQREKDAVFELLSE